jgi:hypothetical protein
VLVYVKRSSLDSLPDFGNILTIRQQQQIDQSNVAITEMEINTIDDGYSPTMPAAFVPMHPTPLQNMLAAVLRLLSVVLPQMRNLEKNQNSLIFLLKMIGALQTNDDSRQTDLHLSTLSELIPRHFYSDPETMYAGLMKMLSPRLVTHGFDQDSLLLVETRNAKCRFCGFSCSFKEQSQLNIEYDSNREFDYQVGNGTVHLIQQCPCCADAEFHHNLQATLEYANPTKSTPPRQIAIHVSAWAAQKPTITNADLNFYGKPYKLKAVLARETGFIASLFNWPEYCVLTFEHPKRFSILRNESISEFPVESLASETASMTPSLFIFEIVAQ